MPIKLPFAWNWESGFQCRTLRPHNICMELSLAINGNYFILFYFLFNYIYNSTLKRVILNFDWRSLELHIIGFLINSISSIQDFVLFYFLFIWVEVRTTMMKDFAQQTTRCVTKSHHVWLRWIRCSLQWVLSAWVGSSTIKWALWVKT